MTIGEQPMDNITQALRLVRPADALDASAKICDQLPQALESIGALAQPFTPLSDKVLKSFEPLALDRDSQQNNPAKALQAERELIEWYQDRNQMFQAVALAREWLVSWVMLQMGMGNQFSDKSMREQVERALGAAVQQRRQKAAEEEKSAADGQKPIDLSKIQSDVVTLFDQLGNLRNDLMHAGKRPNPLQATSVEKKMREFLKKLKELPLS
ncbi:TM1812 family CRISPR-associated protein [Chloroflexus sp.]|uniref:TM1812 family CRISPR-associated protein n=1 Tax=Chloroflexus sp. TaxID=1904827 RepID=UPI002606CF6C|nr:TM1812 family CRISPR-associated protein [uncultured Chloroflexus sp.]